MRVWHPRPPRYDKKRPPLTVGRGPVPRHRSRARPCKSGSPNPDLFVIRRAQTTAGETHIMTMEIAGDRPPRYGTIETGMSLLRGYRLHRDRGCQKRDVRADSAVSHFEFRCLSVAQRVVNRFVGSTAYALFVQSNIGTPPSPFIFKISS